MKPVYLSMNGAFLLSLLSSPLVSSLPMVGRGTGALPSSGLREVTFPPKFTVPELLATTERQSLSNLFFNDIKWPTDTKERDEAIHAVVGHLWRSKVPGIHLSGELLVEAGYNIKIQNSINNIKNMIKCTFQGPTGFVGKSRPQGSPS